MNEIIKIFLENPIAQTIGLIAFIVNLVAYSSNQDKYIKILGAIALIIWAIHYSFLGLYTGAIIAIIGSIRNIYSLRYSGNKKVIYVFFILYTIGAIITFKSLFSIFSLIAAYIYLYAFFNLKGLYLRYAMIFGNIFWFLYAFYGQSIGLLISEIIFTVGTIKSIIYIKNTQRKSFLYKLKKIFFKKKNLKQKVICFLN